MFERFRRTCNTCKKRSPTNCKGCEDKLADDFFYYKYKKQTEVNKLLCCSHNSRESYKNKVGLANAKNNNHWLVTD